MELFLIEGSFVLFMFLPTFASKNDPFEDSVKKTLSKSLHDLFEMKFCWIYQLFSSREELIWESFIV
jgi:hypothetical protein